MTAADTVRLLHIEALRRRAATHQGAVRRLLDQRLHQLQQLQASCADAASPQQQPSPLSPTSPPAPAAGTLAALLAHIARQAAPAGELKAMHVHRSTWARLNVQQRLTQSQALVPHNAGPLNTQRLLHQALTRMHAASPAYLQQLVSQVETLLALDR